MSWRRGRHRLRAHCATVAFFIIISLEAAYALSLSEGSGKPHTLTRITKSNPMKLASTNISVPNKNSTNTLATSTEAAPYVSPSSATEDPAIPISGGGGTSSTEPPIDICTSGLRAVITNSAEEVIVREEPDFLHTLDGEVILSVFTTDPSSALFVVDRVNHVNVLETDFDIGLRVIFIDDHQIAENLLLQEVQYLQQCVTQSIGIFIDYDIYISLEGVIKDLEYNIWPLIAPRAYIFPKVAHLLYQMPWGEKIASVEILTESLQVYNEFMEAVRQEHMCLMHFKNKENIYILFGNKMANNFKENGTIFAVPTERTDRAFIAELPDKSFVLMEQEIDLELVGQNSSHVTLSESLMGKSVLPSRMFAFARSLLDMVQWLRASIAKHCKRVQGVFMLQTCNNFLTFIEDWEANSNTATGINNVAEILDVLHLRKFINAMNFQMFWKKDGPAASHSLESDDQQMELREIASQNFVTNVTTFYHYNHDNHTSIELKAKFGQVFNCQYSAGGNARYPFLYDGESVMYWRLKPDTWVATGITAAILGIIITLAILVFIVVRISLGDVFEGNPVTSILLLLSLILLFTTFIPFSLEYVGEHPNSHVTFEDAVTLNTLCSVRIFVLTLVYCFTFSLLLCRAIMLASIGSEGGFLSHVNGYIQAIICVFSVCVQLGMSVQLLVVMHIATESISCESMYYGFWLFGLMAYDFLLLLCVVCLVPFIYRSQRNYREGILIVIGAVLIFIIWIVWITMAFFGDEIRDAAIPLGLQATGWAVLIGILVPRTFLIVRGIERSDIAQALPSLTSLAFAQNNQYSSEQSVYECVNPAMRNCSQEDFNHQTPSEMPTLPLRGGGQRRQQFFANLRQANANINPQRLPPRTRRDNSPTQSEQSSLPDTPDNSKITRF